MNSKIFFLYIVGYIGENCHFATFRKTCEELALLGYTRNDVYLIDIDGNGKFPPAHVKCEFQIEADSSTTVVEHNLPSQVVSISVVTTVRHWQSGYNLLLMIIGRSNIIVGMSRMHARNSCVCILIENKT